METLVEHPEIIAGELSLWLDPGAPVVVTAGRTVTLGYTDDWKAVLRRLVRVWDLEEEGAIVEATLDQLKEAFGA